MELIKQYIEDVAAAAREVDNVAVEQVIDVLERAYHDAKTVCTIGNGGSAAAASHFAEDLAKGVLRDHEPKRYRVLSLTDNTPYITAIANDIGFEEVFLFQLRQFASSGDVLVAVSGSGNSPNVIKAADYAKANGICVIAFTGFDGGKLGKLADYNIHVPVMDMCKTEAVHAIVMHLITDLLMKRLCAK
jgi:D-sedoheptulose 7-phosphate isomerase